MKSRFPGTRRTVLKSTGARQGKDIATLIKLVEMMGIETKITDLF